MNEETLAQRRKSLALLEEIANSITHGMGAFLSLAALVLLIVFASLYGGARHIVSCTIFGFALVLLYTASTLYHSFRKPRVKFIFKIIDHSCIYILIAGTYTPFMLVAVRGVLGWTIFGIVWGMTVLGILFKSFFIHRFKILSTLAYIAMGWIAIFAIKPIFQSLSEGAVFWLIVGGLAYTLGTIFYAWKKLPFNHAIWHFFVLAGSVCHFFAVLFYVIPLKT
ncbi:MAG TPA: hemolysin III family protein [Smithellaceae bacterium]|nr:hemolysin III family protein [Smithellaceae bacterium]HRS89959.1 hemolysin III family protein [Smithellaceae bacterium]HRV25853.1 hemolysin III family protein [Smithellaceae bacterium]